MPAEEPHPTVLVEVGRVSLPVGAPLGGHQPTGVRVPEAGEHVAHATAVGSDMGTVGVTLFVGVGVVLAVVGDPGDGGSLHRHRAQHGEGVFGRLRGLEGTVGEKAVEADGDADRRQQVHRRGNCQVDRADEAVPEQDDGDDGGQEGDHHAGEVGGLLDPRHLSHRTKIRAYRRYVLAHKSGIDG